MARLVCKYERIPEGNEVGLLESVLIPLAAGCMGSLSQQASEQTEGGQTCGLKSGRSQHFLCCQSLLLFCGPAVS